MVLNNFYGPYAKTSINFTRPELKVKEFAIIELQNGCEEDYSCFMGTLYWHTFIFVWTEVHLLFCDIRKLYVERKDLKENDIAETEQLFFVQHRGSWYEAEKAAFTTRYEEKSWKTNLDEFEEKAKHGAQILDEFFGELGRPVEYEDGVIEAMARRAAALEVLATKRGKVGKQAQTKIAANAADAISAALSAEDAVGFGQWYFRAEKTLFDHSLWLIDRLRKEIGEEKGTNSSHKEGEEQPIKDEEMT